MELNSLYYLLTLYKKMVDECKIKTINKKK